MSEDSFLPKLSSPVRVFFWTVWQEISRNVLNVEFISNCISSRDYVLFDIFLPKRRMKARRIIAKSIAFQANSTKTYLWRNFSVISCRMCPICTNIMHEQQNQHGVSAELRLSFFDFFLLWFCLSFLRVLTDKQCQTLHYYLSSNGTKVILHFIYLFNQRSLIIFCRRNRRWNGERKWFIITEWSDRHQNVSSLFDNKMFFFCSVDIVFGICIFWQIVFASLAFIAFAFIVYCVMRLMCVKSTSATTQPSLLTPDAAQWTYFHGRITVDAPTNADWKFLLTNFNDVFLHFCTVNSEYSLLRQFKCIQISFCFFNSRKMRIIGQWVKYLCTEITRFCPDVKIAEEKWRMNKRWERPIGTTSEA